MSQLWKNRSASQLFLFANIPLFPQDIWLTIWHRFQVKILSATSPFRVHVLPIKEPWFCLYFKALSTSWLELFCFKCAPLHFLKLLKPFDSQDDHVFFFVSADGLVTCIGSFRLYSCHLFHEVWVKRNPGPKDHFEWPAFLVWYMQTDHSLSSWVPTPTSIIVFLWVFQFASLFKERYSQIKALKSSHFITFH